MKASSAYRTQIIREALARDADCTLDAIAVIGQEDAQRVNKVMTSEKFQGDAPDHVDSILETTLAKLSPLVDRLVEIKRMLGEKEP